MIVARMNKHQFASNFDHLQLKIGQKLCVCPAYLCLKHPATDLNGIVHPKMKMGGTESSRISSQIS